MMSDFGRPGYLLTVNWPITTPGGVNEVVLSLGKQLKLSGYAPVISASKAEAELIRGTEVVSLGIEPPITEQATLRPLLAFLLKGPSVLRRLIAFLKQRNIRVVNAHYPDLDVYYFWLLQRLGLYRGRLLMSFHGADVQALFETRGTQRAAWRFLLRHTDGNTACSEALRHLLLTFEPSAKVTTIHNGSDTELFLFRDRPSRPRRIILQVAKFENKKGQDVLLRAFAQLSKTIEDVRLILVGSDGPGLQQIRSLIGELGLGDRVELYLNVVHKEVAEIMRRSDIFALPSRVEPFGIVLLEAGASLLPVVASRVGGIPELLEDGVTGLLVEPEDVNGLESALRELLSDDEKATTLARNWHEKATTHWSWQRTCERYLALAKNQ